MRRAATSTARGMTLMEVLIAVTLVALLSTGMLYALRAGLGSVETIDRRIEADRKASGAQRILEQEFAHMLPVMAPCRAGAEGLPGGSAAFFDGEPQVMRFVSAYSLEGAARGQAKIVEMFVIPSPDRSGVRLVVNELPYFNPLSAGMLCFQRFDETLTGRPFLTFAPPQPTANSFVLADRLERLSFAYRELPSVAEPGGRWTERWMDPSSFPDAVRVDMVPLKGDSIQIPPLPLFVRIPVTRRASDAVER
jgi:prepilin-type N-terminal cleavage/methylation domain-containing protein